MDLVADKLLDDRTIWVLMIVDTFSRQCTTWRFTSATRLKRRSGGHDATITLGS
jgi:hypothetical protein